MTTTIESNLDREALTMTFTAVFDADAERVWQVWEDPRQLERWWGPPTWPATFDRHELHAGGESRYYMTGPEGDKAHAWMRTLKTDKPRSFTFEDGFSDENGEPDYTMPINRSVVTLEETDGGTRMTTVATFASLEDLDRVTSMGMVEGMTEAMGQIEEVLASTLKA